MNLAKKPSNWPEVVVGLTGVVASGKSTVARMIAREGVPVIDTDHLARQAVSPRGRCYEPLVRLLGPDILNDKGEIDRKRLLKRILDDRRLKERIEKIIHPEVLRLLDDRLTSLAAHGKRLVVVEVPLLFEAGWEGLFDRLVCVVSPEKEIQRRLQGRSGTDWEMVKALSDTQLSQDEKSRQSDLVILNDSSLTVLEKRVKAVLQAIKKPGSSKVLWPE